MLGGGADRRDFNVIDGDPLEIGQLLPQRVPLGRDPANDPVRHRQLLHHEIQMAVERADGRAVLGGFDGLVREFLLAPDLRRGARAALALPGEIENQRIGGSGRNHRVLSRAVRGVAIFDRL
jgi:hypothetical protein